ncbi:SDR family oxidoreductase [Polycladidibacter stylochi]|uniref:SDR family oxidoreductase n=1 Tax=Polycladidibacter stylochi TaxID=1807766 RepID=UPI000833184A|nr:SDR family oxidoreductase [Pseudovibrio stylochi]
MHLLILGCGYSAQALVKEYSAQFDSVTGTTRDVEKREALETLGISALIFDGQTASETLLAAVDKATHILISVAPDEAGDPVYNLLSQRIAAKQQVWVGYLSTIGVYGDHNGAWVYEDTPCYPVSARSQQRVLAEQNWLRLAKEQGFPLAVFRLSGIYGPGRNAFVNLQRGTAKRIIKKGQVFNRIHCEDIAGAVMAAIEKNAAGVYNVSDDEPSAPQDVVEYAAQIMGVTPPAEIAFEDAQMSPMARSFYGEIKRANNDKMKQELGYQLKYPTYREAFDHMWVQGWQG